MDLQGPGVIIKPLSFGLIGGLYDFEYRNKTNVDGAGPDAESEVAYFCYTNLLHRDDLPQDSSFSASPLIVQGRVPKALELRITIVGERIFPVAIATTTRQEAAVDWRRLGMDIGNVERSVHKLPSNIEASLRNFMRDLNLVFGCIGMIVTPEGEYVFLEVNPSGQWGWIECLTGLPISRSIAELLANPPGKRA